MFAAQSQNRGSAHYLAVIYQATIVLKRCHLVATDAGFGFAIQRPGFESGVSSISSSGQKNNEKKLLKISFSQFILELSSQVSYLHDKVSLFWTHSLLSYSTTIRFIAESSSWLEEYRSEDVSVGENTYTSRVERFQTRFQNKLFRIRIGATVDTGNAYPYVSNSNFMKINFININDMHEHDFLMLGVIQD